MFIQHSLIEVWILEESSNDKQQGSYIHLDQIYELIADLIGSIQVLLEVFAQQWLDCMPGQFYAQLDQLWDLVLLILNWNEGRPDCVCGTEESNSHVVWEVADHKLQKLL